MAEVVALIDGFNMYGALNTKVRGKYPFAKYKWVNYWTLMEQFLQAGEDLKDAYFFTTYPEDGMWEWKTKRARHVALVDVQRDAGVEVIMGRFAPRKRQCLVPAAQGGCGKQFIRHEEKRTDVNVAVKLVSLAYERCYNTAFLVTADSDLIAAVEQAKICHPEGRIVNVVPIGRLWEARHLKPAVDAQRRMKERHLTSAVLPSNVTLANGRIIQCPNEWRQGPRMQ